MRSSRSSSEPARVGKQLCPWTRCCTAGYTGGRCSRAARSSRSCARRSTPAAPSAAIRSGSGSPRAAPARGARPVRRPVLPPGARVPARRERAPLELSRRATSASSSPRASTRRRRAASRAATSRTPSCSSASARASASRATAMVDGRAAPHDRGADRLVRALDPASVRSSRAPRRRTSRPRARCRARSVPSRGRSSATTAARATQVAFWDVHEHADREHSAIGDHVVVRLATTPGAAGRRAPRRRALARALVAVLRRHRSAPPISSASALSRRRSRCAPPRPVASPRSASFTRSSGRRAEIISSSRSWPLR